jgi:hypothetical protein
MDRDGVACSGSRVVAEWPVSPHVIFSSASLSEWEARISLRILPIPQAPAVLDQCAIDIGAIRQATSLVVICLTV